MAVRPIAELAHALLRDKRFRYLAAGGVNTVFGYGVGLLFYELLRARMHILVICTISTIVCITFSFLTYKLFVFCTKGNWIKEYLRCYIVYGGSSLIGIFSMWCLVDGLHIPFWLAQLIIICLTVAVSYMGHKKYTFETQ